MAVARGEGRLEGAGMTSKERVDGRRNGGSKNKERLYLFGFTEFHKKTNINIWRFVEHR